jgi:hypothetical protein
MTRSNVETIVQRFSRTVGAPRLGRAVLIVWASFGPLPLARADEPAPAGVPSTVGLDPSLALDPSAPQAASLPGGTTPAFGQRALDDQQWRFDFHGFLTAPLNAGINKRVNPRDGQSRTVLHAPPIVPDDFETFSHTGIVPTTYAQPNFSYGNSSVSGNVSILARQASVSESFLEPASQLGINDVFLNILPKLGDRLRLRILIGAFTSRYGATGEYDEGRYGMPLIARINGMGEQASLKTTLGDFTLLLEQGIHGQTNKAGSSITPDLWNGFADPAEGSTFVNHLHAGVGYQAATLGGHFISAWSQDERATGTLAPDGSIVVLATDLRLSLGRFGHFYAAFSRADAKHAHTVSRIFSVLNTPGGPGLMNNYLGSEADGGDGTGSLTTFGGQYDLSVGRLVSYPVPFGGDGPDVFVSVFGMGTRVKSAVPAFNAVTKYKYGAEATYSLLSWFAVSGRYDRVAPNRDSRQSFAVVSPRLIFRTGWTSTDQVVLQYSHWLDGAFTTVRVGAPPKEDVTVVPDSDTISLSASMWW